MKLNMFIPTEHVISAASAEYSLPPATRHSPPGLLREVDGVNSAHYYTILSEDL